MQTKDVVRENTSIVFGLLTLLLIGVLAFALAEFRNYQTLIYDRCRDRVVYDQAANAAREADVQYHLNDQRIETANPYIDGNVRQQRIDNAQMVIDAKRAANETILRGSCEVFRPNILGLG